MNRPQMAHSVLIMPSRFTGKSFQFSRWWHLCSGTGFSVFLDMSHKLSIFIHVAVETVTVAWLVEVSFAIFS